MAFACDSSVQIISAKKQNIIPGVQTVKPYSKYLVEVEVNSNKTIKIDSVIVLEKDKLCRKATYFIKDKGTNNVVAEVNVQGAYVIDATVNESSKKTSMSCEESVNKMIVFYKVNNRSKVLGINSFTEETVRRR